MRNLQEIYDKNELHYWCNACGDINVPGRDPLEICSPDELPAKARNLYDNYWEEGPGCWMYVVQYGAKYGLALDFLFCKTWCADLSGIKEKDVTDEHMERMWMAVKDVGRMLDKEVAAQKCELWTGYNTDPDGHEIIIYVPYEERDKAIDLAHHYDERVYSLVETLY